MSGPLFLSFIVPCYNAGKYIQRCLNSLYCCGLPESQFEIVCVDDCSNDDTNEIVEANQSIHPNIIIIQHERNLRAGGARNTGLLSSRGKYIWYVDSDDFIMEGSAKYLIQQCEKYDLDTFSFNMSRVDENGILKNEIVFKNTIVGSTGIDFLNTVFGEQLVFHLGFPCRTIYRRSLLLDNDIFFPTDMRFGEDTTYMMEAISKSSKTGCVPDVFYYYYQNGDSSSFLKKTSGDLVCQSTLSAGIMIHEFAQSVGLRSKTLEYSVCSSIPWFVNRFFVYLLRVSHKEKLVFYKEVRKLKQQNYSGFIKVCSYLNTLNKMIVRHPCMGCCLIDVLSCGYKLVHLKER